MAVFIALSTVLATFLGGALALKSKDRLHLVLGLSGGLLLGLVAFDLIPEVFELSDLEIWHTPAVMVAFVVGFLLLHILERASGIHEPTDSEYEPGHTHTHERTGIVAAIGMLIHIFLDGVGIGLAFQVSTTLGWVVALAVVSHAFSDGLNTVSLLIKDGKWQSRSVLLLVADGVARVSGALLGTRISISDDAVGIYLALFAGFLIYLATSHILPEAHSKHPSRVTLIATGAGTLLMFVIVNVLHG